MRVEVGAEEKRKMDETQSISTRDESPWKKQR